MPDTPRCFGRHSNQAPVCSACFARTDCRAVLGDGSPLVEFPAPRNDPVSGVIEAGDFHLGYTLYSGQMFRWGRDRDGWWKGVTHKTAIHLRQVSGSIHYEASQGQVDTYAGRMNIEAFLSWYLRIAERPRVVVPRADRRLRAARDRLRGFRFGRQDPFECAISYILSVQAHMGLTKQRVNLLARLLGRPVDFGGSRYYTFPEPADLALLSDAYYRHLRFGWRSKFLPVSARLVADAVAEHYGGDAGAVDLAGWRNLVDRLRATPNSGIGLKVQKCIDLFSLERIGSVPVDTWVRKMAADWYEMEGTDAAITRWAEERGGKWAGYMNEYLFVHYRELNATSLDDRVISFCETDEPSGELPCEPIPQGADGPPGLRHPAG